LLIRWIHAISAVTWVGGSMFYVLVIRPDQRRDNTEGSLISSAGLTQFRGLVNSCIVVLLVTGTIMLFDRLAEPSTTEIYFSVAVVKICLALVMFSMARNRWRNARKTGNTDGETYSLPFGINILKINKFMSRVNLTVIFGLGIFLISDVLQFLFQKGLTGG